IDFFRKWLKTTNVLLTSDIQKQFRLSKREWLALGSKINAVKAFRERSLSINSDQMKRARTIADIATTLGAQELRRLMLEFHDPNLAAFYRNLARDRILELEERLDMWRRSGEPTTSDHFDAEKDIADQDKISRTRITNRRLLQSWVR